MFWVRWISAACWGHMTNIWSSNCRGWAGTEEAWPIARRSLSCQSRRCSSLPGKAWCRTSRSPTCTPLRRDGGTDRVLVKGLLRWRFGSIIFHWWPVIPHNGSALTKHPDVTGGGESSEVDGFRSHPFDRKFTFRSWYKDKQSHYICHSVWFQRVRDQKKTLLPQSQWR